MTRREAARILDPETTAEALAEIEYYGGFEGYKAKLEAVDAACEIAVAALRDQAEAEKNDPLTVEELRGMSSEPGPVYLVSDKYPLDNGWRICCGEDKYGAIEMDSGYFSPEAFASGAIRAYRRKPEEGTK